MKSAISIDVEDAVSLAMRNFFGKRIKPTGRVVRNTNLFLELLHTHGVRATFFVLGEVALEYPDLVCEIDAHGHEVGVHGFSHLEFDKIDRKRAFQEISRAKNLIEDILGKPVKGHRAPAFSISDETSWVFETLVDAGFEYDSSVMPVKGRRYGWRGFEKRIHEVSVPDGRTIVEVPLSVCSFLGRDFPVCGGGYFRLSPLWLSRYAFNKVAAERPVIMYFHPHEIDVGPYPEFYMSEIRNGGLKKRMKIMSYWVNRSMVKRKLEKILSTFHLSTIQEAIQGHRFSVNDAP